MSERIDDHAIMRRLGRLRGQYRAFTADPRARLLLWRLRDDERRMLDALVATEHDARLGRLPDLLVVLPTAFEYPMCHGSALRDALCAQYAQGREDDPAQAPELDWSPPSVGYETSDVDALVVTAASLAEHHAAWLEHVTLVLCPASLVDDERWCTWLRRLVTRLPERVRVVVLDREEAPVLDALAAAEPERVVTSVAALDMDGAILELSQGRPDDRSLEAEVRRGFVRMMLAGRRGDPEGAVAIGTPALHAVTREARWDLVATLQLAMGSLYGAHGRPEAARERYALAAAAAARAEAHGDAAGPRLHVQALLAQGSTHLRLEQWSDAARVYQQATALAHAQGDLHTASDGRRLASLAHEHARRTGDA